MTDISLIISTYNWVEALDLILLSVKRQSLAPQEVIIADDGTSDQNLIQDILEVYKRQLNCPIVHVYQEDKGNRKSRILNKAIAQARAEYLIQIDGDIIMHKDFIKDHVQKIEPQTYLFGSRANIKKTAVSKVIQNKQTYFSPFSSEIKKKSRTLRCIPLSELEKKSSKFSKKFRGCNVSYWKKDAVAINGYNEDFEGWGREDSDFAIRLLNNGVQARRLKFCAIAYHLYHPAQSKENLEKNHKIQEQSIQNKVSWVEKGLNQYQNNTA